MDLITLALALKNGGGGGGQPEITVDGAISGTSANPVENRVIAAALNLKADKTEIEDFVTGDDVEAAIGDAVGDIVRFAYYLCSQGEYDAQGVPTVVNPDTNHIYLTPGSNMNLNMYAFIAPDFVFLGTTEIDMDGYLTDDDLDAALVNYYTKTQVENKLDEKADALDLTGYYTKDQVDDALDLKMDLQVIDTTPQSGSRHLITSGAVCAGLAAKQDALQFDNTPISGSAKPVKSGGVYTALQDKADASAIAKMVSGSDKAYTVAVSNSAPAAGTADNIITIVV